MQDIGNIFAAGLSDVNMNDAASRLNSRQKMDRFLTFAIAAIVIGMPLCAIFVFIIAFMAE